VHNSKQFATFIYQIATSFAEKKKTMHKSTLTTEEQYRKSYEKIIRSINKNGRVELTDRDGKPYTVNIGRSMRRIDIYSLIAQDVGYGHSEYTAARYIKKILKEKSKGDPCGRPNSPQ
jgi:hypothetical protein